MDVYDTVLYCRDFLRKRLDLKQQDQIQLFPQSSLLELSELVFFGPLPRLKSDKRFTVI